MRVSSVVFRPPRQERRSSSELEADEMADLLALSPRPVTSRTRSSSRLVGPAPPRWRTPLQQRPGAQDPQCVRPSSRTALLDRWYR